MMHTPALTLGIVCLCTSGVSGQTVALEAQQAAGSSSESINAAASQLRLLGELRPGFRFEVEGAWGARSRDESDVFGTAYPYEGDVDVMSAYVTYVRPPARGLRSITAGRYRTPFGISAASEHAYVGFLRAPLIRYGGYYALSNGYLEHGLDVTVGVPSLSLEVSLGRPADVGEALRRGGISGAMRVEAVAGPLIVGVSYIDTTPYLPERFALGRTRFGGIDVRWFANGWLLRGEWLGGQPFDGTSTTGGFADLLVHRPELGPVTLLARAERLAYDAKAPFALYTHRYATGMRVRLWKGLSLSSLVVHQAGQQTQRRPTAIDVGLTYAVRHDF
jgi:hypothetical protein